MQPITIISNNYSLIIEDSVENAIVLNLSKDIRYLNLKGTGGISFSVDETSEIPNKNIEHRMIINNVSSTSRIITLPYGSASYGDKTINYTRINSLTVAPYKSAEIKILVIQLSPSIMELRFTGIVAT